MMGVARLRAAKVGPAGCTGAAVATGSAEALKVWEAGAEV